MDKYIGFDIDSKKTVACVVQKGKKDRFTTLKTDINQMKDFLNGQRRDGEKLRLTFESSDEGACEAKNALLKEMEKSVLLKRKTY